MSELAHTPSCCLPPTGVRTLRTLLLVSAVLLAAVEAQEPTAPQVASPRISEVVAVPGGELLDEDGDAEPWVELWNPGAAPFDLQGWFLADDPARPQRWSFPEVAIPPRGYLLVHLSGKNRREPERPLHTSFRLAGRGETVLLVRPDGETVADSLPVPLPPQHRGISLGYAQGYRERELIADAAACRWFVPVRGREEAGWLEPDFPAKGWLSGVLGLGFDTKPEPTFSELIRTDVKRFMHRRSQSILIRVPFILDGPADLLRLDIKFEDGFAAFLNGKLVARANAPHPQMLDWGSGAADWQRDAAAERFHEFDLPGFHETVTTGENLLCLQGLTYKLASRDLIIAPRLLAIVVDDLAGDSPLYLREATPGRPNGEGLTSVTPAPGVSRAGGVLAAPATVEFSAAGGEGPAGEEAVVRYTLDGSEPTPDSPQADGAILVDHSLWLRARAFRAGELPSAIVSEQYVVLAEDLRDFTSDLPIVLVDSGGVKIRPKLYRPARIQVHGVGSDGRSRLTSEPQYSGRCGIKTRGSSTLNRKKKAYTLELRDARGRDAPSALLGLPADSDWVLYAPFTFDESGLRNALVYALSRQMGRYAPRTRFCEVFVNAGDGRLSRESYVGLYVLMEKITRASHRVDVEKLTGDQDAEPEIAGGYILKIDRPGPDDIGFVAGYQKNVQHSYPKERHITRAQSAWIRGYLDEFGRALSAPDFADPERGYARYIDVDSWIDFHLMQEFTKNPDAYTLSTVFHKPRGGKLTVGPLWDFDRAFRTNERSSWMEEAADTDEVTDVHDYGWWGLLFRDPAFRARYRARGRELRATVLSTKNVGQLIDEMAAEIAEVKQRDDEHWGENPVELRQVEIDRFKEWVSAHGGYLDARYLEPPTITSSTGAFLPPCTLTLTSPGEEDEIYYTLDGTNPVYGGEPTEPAILYTAPIEITEERVVRAKVMNPTGSSDYATAECVSSVPTLTISELHYNPEQENSLEFLELHNYGEEPVPLAGLDFWWGLGFAIPRNSTEVLAPGEYAIIATHELALRSFYRDQEIRVLGEYGGFLNNYGERLTLHGPRHETICDLYFSESWVVAADGKGKSMVLVDPSTHGDRLNDPASWRESKQDGGSPGRADE